MIPTTVTSGRMHQLEPAGTETDMQSLLEANKRMLAEKMVEEKTLLNQYQMLVVARSTVS